MTRIEAIRICIDGLTVASTSDTSEIVLMQHIARTLGWSTDEVEAALNLPKDAVPNPSRGLNEMLPRAVAQAKAALAR